MLTAKKLTSLPAAAALLLLTFAGEALAHRALRVDDLNVTLEISRVLEGGPDGDEHVDEGLEPGLYEIRLYVQDISQEYAPLEDARVEVSLLRGGRSVEDRELTPRGAGEYVGRVTFPEPGSWVLQVRITRAAWAPARVEFPLEIEAVGTHSGEGGPTWVGWAVVAAAGVAALGLLRQILASRARRSRAPGGS